MKSLDLSKDEFIQNLKNNVFPSNWKNPKAADTYDLVVVGGGPGGMTAATIARMHNAKVALIEKEHLGGECLNVGCIPSKAFLRSSRLAAEVRDAADLGIAIPDGWTVDFPAVMQRVRRLRSTLAPHDSLTHFKDMGIDVFLGKGQFTSSDTLEVAGQKLRFKKAIIATGTQPVHMPIDGLEQAGYLTNQNVFDLTALPKRLAVIGGGPIGCELSQGFARFGSEVTLITRGHNLLPRDDSDATDRLHKVMEKDGMQILLQTQVQRVEKKGKEKVLYLDKSSKGLVVDEILIAVGRAPVVEGLGLERAGVIFDLKNGIGASDFLQTSNPNIYTVGDVSSKYKFTHISVELAKLAVSNILNGDKAKRSALIVPWCTYTDPEIAYVGLQEVDIRSKKIPVQTMMVELKDTDRAILDGETTGFVKIHLKEGSDQIIGATIMAKHAGDMIAEIGVAMASQKGLTVLSQAIHPFPTQGQAIRSTADALVTALSKKQTYNRKAS